MAEPPNTGSSTGNRDHTTPSSTRYTKDTIRNGLANKDFEGTTSQLGGVLGTQAGHHIKKRFGMRSSKTYYQITS